MYVYSLVAVLPSSSSPYLHMCSMLVHRMFEPDANSESAYTFVLWTAPLIHSVVNSEHILSALVKRFIVLHIVEQSEDGCRYR